MCALFGSVNVNIRDMKPPLFAITSFGENIFGMLNWRCAFILESLTSGTDTVLIAKFQMHLPNKLKHLFGKNLHKLCVSFGFYTSNFSTRKKHHTKHTEHYICCCHYSAQPHSGNMRLKAKYARHVSAAAVAFFFLFSS